MDLSAINSEIQRLQTLYNTYNNPNITPVAISTPDLKEQIRLIVKEEIGLMLNQAQSTEMPISDEPNAVLLALGELLSEEQQLYFSDNKNQLKLANFLKTAEGIMIFKRFMTLFQDYSKRN